MKDTTMASNREGAFTAYLINPETRSIEAVEMQGGAGHLQDIYRLLGCSLITTAPLSDHDTIYCDDEGLLHGPVYQFFGVSGFPQPLAGRGLVVGLDAEGNDCAPRLSLAEVKERTYFIERLFKDLWGLRQATKLHSCEIAPLAHIEATLTGAACHG
jgi:hypothetical protein